MNIGESKTEREIKNKSAFARIAQKSKLNSKGTSNKSV